ncbi:MULTISPECIES: helix-turn-helix domain-containing protein [unclassified Lysinibacillus]|uniref:helix-turn-helix domain-containing protein n=1 Tax=unclassified Lysinibacillus TaxID=2636778 RepID=UPI00380A5F98
MTKFDNLLVAERVKICRKNSGYSQEELANLLGMKRTNIANYEAGRIIPPGNIIVAMSDIFGVSTDYLLGLSESFNDKVDSEELKVIQRAKTKMSDEDWERAMKILRLSFVEAFDDEDEDEDEDI